MVPRHNQLSGRRLLATAFAAALLVLLGIVVWERALLNSAGHLRIAVRSSSSQAAFHSRDDSVLQANALPSWIRSEELKMAAGGSATTPRNDLKREDNRGREDTSPPRAQSNYREKPTAKAANVSYEQDHPPLSSAVMPDHRFVVCSKVGREIPYLLEWLEFHRLQGVTKFALYTDDLPLNPSRRVDSNTVYLLPRLFAERLGSTDLIDIYPLSPLLAESEPDLTNRNLYPSGSAHMHRLSQQSLLKHCFEKYKLQVEWVVHIDVDEFLYSPTHPSLEGFFESLYELQADTEVSELPLAYQRGAMGGIYVWPVNFGMTGVQVASYRNSFRYDATRGEVDPIFDPRFKGRYNSTQEATAALRNLVHWLNATGRNMPSMKAADRAKWFAQAMGQDPRPTAPKSTFRVSDHSRVAAEMVEDLWERVAAEYPLVIEDQWMRMPSQDYGDSYEEVAATVIQLFPFCESYVRELLKPKHARLRRIGADRERVAKLGEPPNLVCVPGHLPGYITNIGKSITWTRRRFRPPAGWTESSVFPEWRDDVGTGRTRRRPQHNPRFDSSHRAGCAQPWIHHCAHKTTSPVMLASVLTELRLDHHSLRSFETRSIGDVDWRAANTGAGKFGHEQGEMDFGIFTFASLIEDNSKRRFVKELRESLAKLRPVPLQTQILQDSPERSPKFTTHWEHTTCSLPLLISRRQHMCPASHPYVGVLGSGVPPPAGLSPYSWCFRDLDRPRKYWWHKIESAYNISDALGTRCGRQQKDRQAAGCSAVLDRYILEDYPTESLSLCLGYPLTICCDYDPELWDTLRNVFGSIDKPAGLLDAYDATVNRDLYLPHWYSANSLNYGSVRSVVGKQ